MSDNILGAAQARVKGLMDRVRNFCHQKFQSRLDIGPEDLHWFRVVQESGYKVKKVTLTVLQLVDGKEVPLTLNVDEPLGFELKRCLERKESGAKLNCDILSMTLFKVNKE